MKKRFKLLFVLFLIGIGTSLAQTRVTGSVKNENGEPLIGASILVKGTTIGATTNLDDALAQADAVAGSNAWFQYGSDTYLVIADTTTTDLTGDVVIKINGLVDLSTSTVNLTDLTIA